MRVSATPLDFLGRHAGEHPSSPALETAGRAPATFRELFLSVITGRDALCQIGIPAGSTVALHVECPRAFVTLAVTVSTGAVCAPLPLDATPDEAAGMLERLAPSALVCDDGSPFARAARRLGVRTIDVKAVLPLAGRPPFGGQPPGRPALRWGRPRADDVALILQTTGSTGIPKLAAITHRAVVSTCLGSIRSLRATRKDRCLNFMALNHVHGLISGFYLPLIAGCCSYQAGRYSRDGFLSWLADFKPTWFSTTPAIYRDIVSTPADVRRQLEHCPLRFIRCGSSPLPPGLSSRLEKIFGVPLLEAYGTTETLQITGNPVDGRRLGSVGRSIAPRIQIRDQQGRTCAAFVTGSIFVRGASVLSGYYHADLTGRFADGWFDTGDDGWLDDDGFLYLTGRKQDVINRGGENISPVEIEHALLRIEGIDEAIVFSIPHDRLGEDVAAVVVPARGYDISDRALKTALKASLSPWKIPSIIVSRGEIPRSPSGKVIRSVVADTLRTYVSAARAQPGESPTTPTEEYVASCFARVLGLTSLQRDDDFFTLGGSSIDVAQLVAAVSDDLGEIVYGMSLIRHSVVKDFATLLDTEYLSAVNRHLGLDDDPGRPRDSSSRPPITFAETERFRDSLQRQHRLQRPTNRIAHSPVFVLSSPRAGSTLLRIMLGGHPEIFAPPELRLMPYPSLTAWKRELSGERAFYQEGLLQAVMSAFAVDAAGARNWIDNRARATRSVLDVYRELCVAVYPRVLVDKTPHYALDGRVLEQIESSFERPRYIFLVRNPIDVIDSFVGSKMGLLWMSGGEFHDRRLAELVWHECNRNIVDFVARVPDDRKHAVHFEHLVTEPARSMMRLCSFLNTDFREEMLDVYDGRKARMTDGVFRGARMVGDPRFDHHRSIDPKVAASGFRIPHRTVGSPTAGLAAALGYSADQPRPGTAADRLCGDAEAARRQISTLLGSWRGARKCADSLIVGKNLSGRKVPLYWCMQGYRELELLAEALGPEQPVYGMRSGHLLFKKDSDIVPAVARFYADEIVDLRGDHPLALGGNCQGGHMAFAIADGLEQRGLTPGILCLLETEIPRPTRWDVSLFYGEDSSELHNPFKRTPSPEAEWRCLYKSTTVDLVKGSHGLFFEEDNIGDLVGKLNLRLDSWHTRRRDKPDIVAEARCSGRNQR